jgi:ribosomal protein S18 acetylase RimI-like enzyme
VDRAVTITFLEMRDPSWLVPASGGPPYELRRVGEACPALNRFFYREVGRDWRWVDRLDWSDDDWRRWVDRDDLATWIAWSEGNPLGYVELERAGGDVEITYFGLLPQFIGRGYGGPFLCDVVREAWRGEPSRVWLHTCTLDHPAALANYQRRGFRVYREERVQPTPTER